MAATLSLQEFSVVVRKLFNEDGSKNKEGQASLLNMKAYVDAACNSTLKYTDYSSEQINSAFANSNILFEMYVPSSEKILVPAGLALATVKEPIVTINLLFTLPAGKGHMLISRLIGHSRVVFSTPTIDKIVCRSYGFSWIYGPCTSHGFVSVGNNNYEYRTNILHFNQHPVIKMAPITELVTASSEIIKMEPTIERGPFSLKEFFAREEISPEQIQKRPLYSSFISHLLKHNIVTKEELSRSRSDVRVSVLRPGQSSNPLGVHGDFTPRESETEFFCNPEKGETLKVIIVSSGKPGTRIYTKPVNVSICTKEWTKVWREAAVQDCITSSQDFFDSESGCPVVFTDMQLHEARALTASDMQTNETASPRIFMRLVIYPKSRLSEVPKESFVSLHQVYVQSVEMQS